MKKTKQLKLPKNDLVRELAATHLGIAAYSISDGQLDNYCKEMVKWRMKNNGKGLYKEGGVTFKDDFVSILNKYHDIALRESLSESIGENAFNLTDIDLRQLREDLAIIVNDPPDNLEAAIDGLFGKYK